MNNTPHSHPVIPSRKPLPASLIPVKRAAKWPPDDDALPPGPGVPSYSGGGGDDGNFKKGRFGVAAVIVGVLIAGAAAAIFLVAGTKSAEQMTPKQIADEKKNVSVLPLTEALPKWREWAKKDDVPKLQEEAFAQLAWVKDPQGLPLIIKGLESTDHRVRGTAATALLEYGTPGGDAAKPALEKALKDSDASDKPQIAWALANLHDATAFDEVLKEYRVGHLSKVQRLDGNPAFDPEQLAAMVSTEQLATLAGDESESVRQL